MTAAASVAGWVRDDFLAKAKPIEDPEELRRIVARRAAEAVSGFWYGVKRLDEEKAGDLEAGSKDAQAEGAGLETQGSGGRNKSARLKGIGVTSPGKGETVEKPISGAGHAGVLKEEWLPGGVNADGIVQVTVPEVVPAEPEVGLAEPGREVAPLEQTRSVEEYALRVLREETGPLTPQQERERGCAVLEDPLMWFVPKGSMAAYRALVEREQKELEAEHEKRVREHEAAVASAQRELEAEEATKAMKDAGLNLDFENQYDALNALNVDFDGLETALGEGGLGLLVGDVGVPGGGDMVDPLGDIPLSLHNDFTVPGMPVVNKKKRKNDRKRKKHHRLKERTEDEFGEVPTPSQSGNVSGSLAEDAENGLDFRNFGQSAEVFERPIVPRASELANNNSHPGTPAGLNPTKRKRTDRGRHGVKAEPKAVSEETANGAGGQRRAETGGNG